MAVWGGGERWPSIVGGKPMESMSLSFCCFLVCKIVGW